MIAPHVGVLSEEGAATTLVELGIDDFEWLAGYLIGLGLDFEVREPARAAGVHGHAGHTALGGARQLRAAEPTGAEWRDQ